MILRRGVGALVPAGTPYFRTQGPLLPTVIGTIAGRQIEGPRGLGAILRRGVRGLGDVQYCANNPPSASQAAYLAANHIAYSIVDCGGTPTPQGTNQGNQPVVTIANPNAAPGAAPVYQAPTDIEDCVSMGLATSAGQACVARNTQRAVNAENAHLSDNQQYQTNLCIANGGGGWVPAGSDVGSWCAGNYGGVVPTSYSPVVSLPVTTAPMSANPPATPVAAQGGSLTFRNLTSGNTSVLNVGDTWQVTITGASPNTQVTVSGGSNGANISAVMGSTDGSGTFTKQGTITADQVGAWQEHWAVGGVASGFFAFNVPAPAGGTAPAATQQLQLTSGGATVATVPASSSSVTAGTFDLGSFLTESVFMGIPNWMLLVGVGGVVLLMGGHRR